MFARSAFKSPTTNIPPLRFPQKLWKIANECQSGAVSWSPHGKSILLRYSLFKEEFMSTKSDFFKTDNISSFVRQLNLYGFRKVYDHAHKQAYKANPDLHEFSNSYFQRDRPELLDQVTRKPGILKDRNDFLSDSHQILESFTDDICEKRYEGENNDHDDENAIPCDENDEKMLQLQVQPVEDSDVKDVLTLPVPEVPESVQLSQPKEQVIQVKKKRGRKPGSKSDPNRPRLPRKVNVKKRRGCVATLKCPDLYPNLIFFKDEDSSPFLRNTSPDVMLSSTLPFQESPEYKELKETCKRLHEHRIRSRYPPVPLSILYHNKANADCIHMLNNIRI